MRNVYFKIKAIILEIGLGTGTDGSHKTVRTAQDRLLHARYGIHYFPMPTHKHEDLDNQVSGRIIMAGRSKAIIFLYWALYSRLYFIHSTVYRPVYNYFVDITQFWLSFRLVCIHQPQFSFFFAILENLANFSTQR